MALTILIGIIAAVCLVSTLMLYIFMRSRKYFSSSGISNIEKQQIIHSFRPSIDIITRRLNPDFRSSVSSEKNDCASYPIHNYNENELMHKKQYRSVGSINFPFNQARSTSMGTTLLQSHRPRSANWRQGSIVDPQQLALIQFSLPIITKDDKYRRRSVAVCNSLTDTKENPILKRDATLPSLLSFSIIYFKNSQLKIQFQSLQSLPLNLHLQQLTLKVKLIPDGKEKSIQIKTFIENEYIFNNDTNESSLFFSNIPFEKLHERILSISIHGKDQTKKTIHLGYIGKIYFNQIDKFQQEIPIDFIHEIEKIKPVNSSIELFISLQKKDDQHVHIDLQRIKGLKIDQKKLDANCYIEIIFLDRHRPLSIKQTKFYQLNSSQITLNEKFDFNILSYNSNDLERYILMFNFYSNSNPNNEYKCLARIKLASPLFCSGSGVIHWQQFQARESFSMWHKLNKEQH